MFVDAVWAHLLVFAVGQLFAWRYAQTGRFWLGAGVTIVLWAAADWWLVSRYLLAVEASRQVPPLLLLQVAAVTTSCAYLWALVRRWRGARGRGDGHRSAVAALLLALAVAMGVRSWRRRAPRYQHPQQRELGGGGPKPAWVGLGATAAAKPAAAACVAKV